MTVTMPECVGSVDEQSVEFYRRNGFVRVRGVLSPDEVEVFADAARRYAAEHREQSYAREYADKVFTQLVNVWRQDETLRGLTLHRRLAENARRLAGVPLRLWHDQLLVKQPHNQAPTEPHQDRPYWPHARSRHSLTAWVALVDVPAERGCLTFLPGSHEHTGLRAQDLTDHDDLFQADPSLRWTERVTVPLRAGDCTFHDSCTAHLATANDTDEPRIAHTVIYMDAETTFAATPHVVTDGLGLEAGQTLEEPLFPML